MVRPKGLQSALKHSAIGIEVGLSVVVGLLLGQFADEYFATSPWLTISGLLLGIVAAFRSLLRATRRMQTEFRDPPDSEEERE